MKLAQKIALDAGIALVAFSGFFAVQHYYDFSCSPRYEAPAQLPEQKAVGRLGKETISALEEFLIEDAPSGESLILDNLVSTGATNKPISPALMLTEDGLILTSSQSVIDENGKPYADMGKISSSGNIVPARLIAYDPANSICLIYAATGKNASATKIPLKKNVAVGEKARLISPEGRIFNYRDAEVIEVGLAGMNNSTKGRNLFELSLDRPDEQPKAGVISIENRLAGFTVGYFRSQNKYTLLAAGYDQIKALVEKAIEYSR
jgi:hypothetical protein